MSQNNFDPPPPYDKYTIPNPVKNTQYWYMPEPSTQPAYTEYVVPEKYLPPASPASPDLNLQNYSLQIPFVYQPTIHSNVQYYWIPNLTNTRYYQVPIPQNINSNPNQIIQLPKKPKKKDSKCIIL
jgi:hypothetical protein